MDGPHLELIDGKVLNPLLDQSVNASGRFLNECLLTNVYACEKHLKEFDDFPFWGYRARVKRHFRRILCLRMEDCFEKACDRMWSDISPGDGFIPLKNWICMNIRYEFSWPCSMFIPADRLEYLMWLRRVDLEPVSFVLSIKNKFSVDIGNVDLWEQRTLGELCLYVYKKCPAL